jgi:phenylacetate-CoA ligase
VELKPGADRVQVESGLKDQLRLKTNLGYDLQFFEYGSLPRYKLKARRFKDLRKKDNL